jgi:poly(3-hydroxybutyrate) depolymerase
VPLESGGGVRQYLLSLPAAHDPSRSYPVVFGLHAGNSDGAAAREWLGLEDVLPGDWAVFVYPDGLEREWSDGSTTTGWQNGPSTPDFFGGTEDLAFIRDVIADLELRLCAPAVTHFATGWGWGGDFASVLGCYAGDEFSAVVPVASNTPYFLPDEADGDPSCVGESAVWVYHGQGADAEYPLEFGLANRDFWIEEHDCTLDGATPISLAGMAADDECEQYACTGPRTRFCAYTASAGMRLPTAYYASATVEFFRGLR